MRPSRRAAAKQILIKANRLPKKCGSNGYVFSIGKVEVRDATGSNLALVSRGAGVTVSSTSYGMMNDRYTQDALWGPLQYDLGNKWVRVGGDNGSFIWPYVEHERGQLKIDQRADESITECRRNGVSVILTLDFKGNWIYMNPPRKTNWQAARYHELNDSYNDSTGNAIDSKEMFAAYLKYIEYMVGRFKDRVEYFEIGNEWDLRMNAHKYMSEVFEPTYEVVKRVAPQAKVMLGSPACHNGALLRSCVSAPVWRRRSTPSDGIRKLAPAQITLLKLESCKKTVGNWASKAVSSPPRSMPVRSALRARPRAGRRTAR